MKLINEVVEEVKYLTEENKDTGKRDYFIEGIFMQAERPNRNRRQYKAETLLREMKRYNEEYIKQNRAYGELGHPSSPSINMERVSHMIKELRAEGHDFYGKAKVIDTPYGNIVKTFIDEGARLGVSTRGVGDVRNVNGIQLVQDNYHLATAADIVADPSAHDAFVQGIKENKEWLFVEGHFVEMDIDQTRAILDATPKRQLEKVCAQLFEDFMTKLSGPKR
jgi:hypothetical protein